MTITDPYFITDADSPEVARIKKMAMNTRYGTYSVTSDTLDTVKRIEVELLTSMTALTEIIKDVVEAQTMILSRLSVSANGLGEALKTDLPVEIDPLAWWENNVRGKHFYEPPTFPGWKVVNHEGATQPVHNIYSFVDNHWSSIVGTDVTKIPISTVNSRVLTIGEWRSRSEARKYYQEINHEYIPQSMIQGLGIDTVTVDEWVDPTWMNMCEAIFEEEE